MTDTLPDRLSNNPRSPFFKEDVLKRDIGVRFNGVEKTNVEEFCISEGWVRVEVGKTKDRYGNPMTIRLNGKVEPYFKERKSEPPVEAETEQKPVTEEKATKAQQPAKMEQKPATQEKAATAQQPTRAEQKPATLEKAAKTHEPVKANKPAKSEKATRTAAAGKAKPAKAGTKPEKPGTKKKKK